MIIERQVLTERAEFAQERPESFELDKPLVRLGPKISAVKAIFRHEAVRNFPTSHVMARLHIILQAD